MWRLKWKELVCRVVGHDLSGPIYEPAENGFWWEIRHCYRCGGTGRELVASKEG
jgi:hypothetical protein